MVQLQPKLLTVRDFIDHYGDNPQYELIDGELTDLEPTGIHHGLAVRKQFSFAVSGTRTRQSP